MTTLIKECVAVEYDHIGRVYVFNDGARYHSVTTMLSATGNKDAIRRWRARVGDKEADRISSVASYLGEQYHLLGEHYLKGTHPPRVNIISKHIFEKSTRHLLDKYVTGVVAVEDTLYTEKYRLAGRADAIVMWKGELAVFDFKLLNSENKQYLADYWIQTSVYAHCWAEMHGVLPQKLVLVVGNKNTLCTTHYESTLKKHTTNMNYRIYQFNSMLGN